ncbi:MAG: winged helix-turn-helix transcriptional regulator [Methanoregula sp.]|nr:winged helix-turn-helix transcriptional regulator [Methanoregula sp.]
MRAGLVRSAALLIFIFIGMVPIAAAGMGSYSVAPISPEDLAGTSQDPVPISFWDLTLREMMIALALSFCPVLVYPVEIFFFMKMISVLGYRKVEQYAVSYNQNRQKIYEFITANPGVKFNALERLTGIKEGTLKYHLLVLGMKRKIISFGRARSMRYFENNGRYNELEKKVFLHLQNPTTRRILEILASSPEVSRKEIAEIVGIAGPSISWHTKRLSGDGIITTRKNGRAVRYTLCPAGVNIFKRHFGQDAGMVSGSAVTEEEMGD